MCIVSNIGDQWSQQRWPQIQPVIEKISIGVSREEFDALKREIESLKELLLAAKKYDKETGQPDCEQDKKVEIIKKVAEALGVNMDEVFKK